MKIAQKVHKGFYFEAGHRLVQHQGKCRNLHGHSYHCSIRVHGDTNRTSGMVVDFYDLGKVRDWVNKHLDHAIILNPEDERVVRFVKDQGYRMFLMPSFLNEPTVENLSSLLTAVTAEYVPAEAGAPEIHLYETAECGVETKYLAIPHAVRMQLRDWLRTQQLV
jgi:6-pyruvoyltetrahydropterin/6-carboxytetrahydropterin synthase